MNQRDDLNRSPHSPYRTGVPIIVMTAFLWLGVADLPIGPASRTKSA